MQPNPHRTEARVVAVTSGKGGVGKTNVALNLAIALAGRAQRVVLWDGGLGLANVQVLLRLQPQGTLSDVLAERKSVREILPATLRRCSSRRTVVGDYFQSLTP